MRMARLVSAVASCLICLTRAGADVIYVSSLGTDEILRYDADTGNFIDTFISAGSGGLDKPHGILERCDDIPAR